jgi:hypothetical protein
VEQELLAMEFLVHPETEWGDLLALLDVGGACTEPVAIQLHAWLNIKRDGRTFIGNRRFWEETLSKAGIKPSERTGRRSTGVEFL